MWRKEAGALFHLQIQVAHEHQCKRQMIVNENCILQRSTSECFQVHCKGSKGVNKYNGEVAVVSEKTAVISMIYTTPNHYT